MDGYSSLLWNTIVRLKYLWAYVDLWPTDGEAAFATALAKAIAA